MRVSGPLAACAVLAVVGAAVLDDYGVSWDESGQIGIAGINWRYILGEGELRFDPATDRYYGVAFELPVLLAKEALGLDGVRGLFLLRHAATYLLFLVGAFFCALLARRLTGSAPISLLVLAMFALQPRIYAHAFFNSKDVPALALFAVCLFLAWRAFRRDTAGVFLLCGAGAGALTNLRIPAGLVFVASVAALRVLDLALAPGAAARRRVLWTLGAFAAGWAGVLYAVSPYLWADPGAFADAVAAFAHHPNWALGLFRGETVLSMSLPPEYFPVWFAVTTPPVLLAFGLAGAASALGRGVARPGAALRNTRTRFALLCAACWAGPPLAAALLGANAYDGWRQMFFIHAPFCLLAALGLAALARRAAALGRASARTVVFAASAGAASAAVSAALLHPHQQVYFNALVDRSTPDSLRDRYDIAYWGPTFRAALEHVLAARPEGRVCVANLFGHTGRNIDILPRPDRERLTYGDANDGACDFDVGFPRERLYSSALGRRPPVAPVWSLKAYGGSILDLYRLDDLRGAHRRVRESAVSGAPVLRGGGFDVHLDGGALVYVREECEAEDVAARFLLRVTPADAADLPADRRTAGFEVLDFSFPHLSPVHRIGMRFDGGCLVAARLPDYRVRGVETGQFDESGRLWEARAELAGADGR